jgi:hypothetical protein
MRSIAATGMPQLQQHANEINSCNRDATAATEMPQLQQHASEIQEAHQQLNIE